jgi:hypothetical protein
MLPNEFNRSVVRRIDIRRQVEMIQRISLIVIFTFEYQR